ncbi:MAG TPA: porphobilinogen synthase, partial [Pyrinomonadaceae bacterium]|nr:porphobilinogen synthase [Pyrinomonadaceae bacterium]
MSDIIHRPRRLRRGEHLRALVRETRLAPEDFVLPLFACPGENVRREVSSMPGVFNLSVDEVAREATAAYEAGVRGVILFGLPETKDETASGAYSERGIVQQAARAVRKAVPDMVVIADTCLCEYTSHGHCGVVRRGEVLNDESLELLARTAVSQAEAGADIVAPSDMMDGRVAAIRSELDREGFEETPIMSYAAKYASAFYGPFREAAESAPAFGDRRTYQMDPANAREALREVALDVQEGADVVMVKPALPYLDVIRRVRESTDLPVAAYNVSGEYAMIKAAAAQGLLDERAAVLEALTAIRRAG